MQFEAIRNRAKADLIITTEQGDQDLFLWEHSLRVAQNAGQIARLSEVCAASPDDLAVYAAALYHDAGWIERVLEGEVTRDAILIRPLAAAHREHGIELLERSLAKLLSRDSIRRAAAAIRYLHDRNGQSIEGQIVMEADLLDEIGAISLWTAIRRGVVDGRGVQAVIDTWRRRKEYHFWDARLKDSFRFSVVRAVAEERLRKFERLMQELETEHSGHDLHSAGRREGPERPNHSVAS